MAKLSTYLYCSSFAFFFCNAIMAVAFPWLLLQQTENIAVVGVFGAIAVAMTWLGSLACAKMVKILGERHMLWVGFLANILGIVSIGSYFIWGAHLSLFLLAVPVILDRFFDASTNIVMESRFPEIALDSGLDIATLNATKEGLTSVATILGPALAGLLLAQSSLVYIFSVSLSLCVLAIVSFLPLLKLYVREQHLEETSNRKTLGWLWNNDVLKLYLILIVVVLGSVSSIDDVILPAFVSVTSDEPRHLGFILASYGVGAICSAILYASKKAILKEEHWILMSVAGIAGFFLSLGVVSNTYVLMGIVFASGMMSGALGPLIDTRFLKDTPAHMRVSMLSVISSIGIGSSPLIILLHSWLIEASSVYIVSVATGIILLCAYGLIQKPLNNALHKSL